MLNKAVFWDRDGVINKIEVKDGVSLSPRSYNKFELEDDIEFIIQKFNSKGFKNFIVTNQPDIARGLMDINELEKINNFILDILKIDEIFFCPHDNSDNCLCRKPKPGMFIKAINKYKLNPQNCYVIGDRITDLVAGYKANIKSLFLLKRSYSFNNYINKNNIPKHNIIRSINEMIPILDKL